MQTSYKIAVVTDDSSTVSHHFGSAPLYSVNSIEDGKIVNVEIRDKFNPHQAGMPHHSHNHGETHVHGQGEDSQSKHNKMLEAILDCKILISRGMGYGIYNHLIAAGIEAVVTDIENIEAAVQACIDGSIVNHSEKLH